MSIEEHRKTKGGSFAPCFASALHPLRIQPTNIRMLNRAEKRVREQAKFSARASHPDHFIWPLHIPIHICNTCTIMLLILATADGFYCLGKILRGTVRREHSFIVL